MGHSGMRVKDDQFHTLVKDIQISFIKQMEKSISFMNNEKINIILKNTGIPSISSLRHGITEILLKVALNTITLTLFLL
jgi:hypothetical protein